MSHAPLLSNLEPFLGFMLRSSIRQGWWLKVQCTPEARAQNKGRSTHCRGCAKAAPRCCAVGHMKEGDQ